MARKYSATYADDFGGGLNWSPETGILTRHQRYMITDASEDGLFNNQKHKAIEQAAEQKEISTPPSWMPSESAVIGLGAILAFFALILQINSGFWKPELLWLSIILALLSVIKSKTR
jgi:hypothetical protein